jgi:nucleotide-binding universal stress UspA family protein
MTAGPLTRRRIVAAIDGAGLSSRVIAIAIAAAPMFDANVEAVHVVEAELAASQARQIAADAGVAYYALTGPLLPTLVTYLTSPDVAVVVVGASTGRRADRLLGRHALALAAAAQRPMIIVPVGAEVGATLHRVLVPLDASSQTRAALKETVELARAAHVEVVALHVHPFYALPMFTDQPQHEVPAWSDEFLRRYWPGSTPLPRLLHRVGVPADEIARAMDETDADMLVLAWSRDLSPGRARIVARALRESRPVLLLPIQPQGATIDGRDLAGMAYRGVASAVV